MSIGRRLKAAAAAFLLTAVAAAPSLVEPRHDALAAPVAHLLGPDAGHDDGSGDRDPDDLPHHARGLTSVGARVADAVAVTVAFEAVDDRSGADGWLPGPFEPPRD